MSVTPTIGERTAPQSHARAPPEPSVTGSFRGEYEPGLIEQGKLRLNQMGGGGMMSTVLGIVVTAVVGFVGLTAMDVTNDATNVSSGEFSSANDALVSGVNSAYSLMEVAFIVAILGIVIAALIGLRGRSR
jgi:hypothetical protein